MLSHFLFLTRRQLGPLVLQAATVTYPGGDLAETAVTARLTAGGVPVTLTGGVGTTAKDDHNTWTLRGPAGAIRLLTGRWRNGWARMAAGSRRRTPCRMPGMRPEVLRRQLASVAAMTRGKTHPLATLREALEVQEVVEAILAARLEGQGGSILPWTQASNPPLFLGVGTLRAAAADSQKGRVGSGEGILFPPQGFLPVLPPRIAASVSRTWPTAPSRKAASGSARYIA